MRYEVIAHKGNQIEYKKTTNAIDALLIAWELKMQGFENVKTVITEF
jgi:hypothetical protein